MCAEWNGRWDDIYITFKIGKTLDVIHGNILHCTNKNMHGTNKNEVKDDVYSSQERGRNRVGKGAGGLKKHLWYFIS